MAARPTAQAMLAASQAAALTTFHFIPFQSDLPVVGFERRTGVGGAADGKGDADRVACGAHIVRAHDVGARLHAQCRGGCARDITVQRVLVACAPGGTR